MFWIFFAGKEWVEYILIDVIYFFIYVLLYRQKYQKLLTSCSIHTESNSHPSAITRCPYLRIKQRLRHAELVSASPYLTRCTIIENNYGQLKQMDAHRYSNNFL